MRGDKESIKNLLEIFDGLLEYLTEQVSEEELADEGTGVFFADSALIRRCFLVPKPSNLSPISC